MKRSAGLVLLALLPAFATSAIDNSGYGAQSTVWTSRDSGLPHITSTTNAEAQRFFDQGLLLIYAFNHAAAIEAFDGKPKPETTMNQALHVRTRRSV